MPQSIVHGSPTRLINVDAGGPMVVKELLPVGSTGLERSREDAVFAERLRIQNVDGYVAESKVRSAALEDANNAAILRNEEFCKRLEASQAEREQFNARNLAQDLAHYTEATSTRRWPVSPVSTRWGIRQAPY
eukprot:TRINITY_DN24210_c0_g1_i1.p1 TRINITY_DN24210_c0_g1~~TRINITY_DN24210_c0_g1_i1.p1  ORF type:complete len:133 (+),score=25.07 TRINITY_DN24210_c0_g1_i1:81-479(+)